MMLTEELIMVVFIFIVGACVGSFLNVCIVRMPGEKSIVTPSSHCVSCLKPIPWHDNVPLLSYLILKGQCRFCKASFSARYFLVELLTALTFVGFYKYYGLSPVLWPYLFMVSCFIVATFVDFAHRIIPDEISIGGMWAGLAFSLFIPALHADTLGSLEIGRSIMRIILVLYILCLCYEFVKAKFFPPPSKEEIGDGEFKVIFVIFALAALDGIAQLYLNAANRQAHGRLFEAVRSLDAAVLGVLVGGGLIYMMGILGDKLFKKEAMGGGDVKLLALIGAFLGWKLAILTFFVSPFFGAVFGIAEKIRTKDSYMPYGPFLVIGALISLFKGQEIIHWILRLHGLE
jgi:leader peptidase (prepilin peptidase)/N-methyltransferase